VFINIEGFYLLEGHADEPNGETALEAGQGAADHKHEPEENNAHDDQPAQIGEQKHEDKHVQRQGYTPLPIKQRKVTSILVLCNNPFGPTALDDAINRKNDPVAQVVSPAREIQSLMNQIVGPLRIILLVLTVLIVIVAGVSILVSIYNSMSERSHDIAVMRALGASRGAVMGIILVESILLALLGGVLGVLLGHGMIALASPYVLSRTGVSLSLFEFDWQELVLIPGLVVLASLVGLLPALAAYRTDVAKSLAGSR
jgi:putative ABC transport system permease protein